MRPAALLALLAAAFATAAEERPNILFFFADDWGRFARIYAEHGNLAGANGLLRTPNLDRLAKEGVLFRNAHVNAPSCTPCRSSLLSGQHFWRTGRGAILQGAVWDESIPTYPLLLRDAGYHLGKSYKVWSPGSPADAPYGGQTHAFEKSGRGFNNFSENATDLVAKGATIEAARAKLLEEVRGNFRAMLAAKAAGQPFAYWFGPTTTHRTWIRGSGQKLWGLDPDALKGKLPAFLPDVPVVREDLADYLGEVQALDAAMGVLLEELDRAGERSKTLIAVSGDHGAPGFPHGKCNLYAFGTGVSLIVSGAGVKGGRVVDDMVTLPDLAPTFLEAGGVKPPAVMTGRSLWNVLKSDRQGQVDPTRTWVVAGRERHVEVARPDYSPYPQRALRTQDHVLIVNFKPERWPLGNPYRLDGTDEPTFAELAQTTFVTLPDDDAGPTKAWFVGARKSPEWAALFEKFYGRRPMFELYDLKADPHEMNNVAEDPAYAAVRKEMTERLFTILRETGDPRMLEDGKYFETPPLAGPLPMQEQKRLPGGQPVKKAKKK
ncbi:MAG: sulfatase [Verrucomicrobia bacterium]|nr:sulfatase [Verrucomicrobiota bacterium]